jgi:hypothetical protein
VGEFLGHSPSDFGFASLDVRLLLPGDSPENLYVRTIAVSGGLDPHDEQI